MGITGLKFIEVTGGTDEAAALEKGGTVASERSFVGTMEGKAEDIAVKVELAVNKINALLSAENIDRFGRTLRNVESTFSNTDALLADNKDDGCGGAKPIDQFYVLANDAKAEPPSDVARCKLPLVIAGVMVAAPYDEANIVFRSDAYEIRYYNYRYWVDPPERMLQSLLERRLDQSGLFDGVLQMVHSPREHLTLYVQLDALEERDRGGKWYARLAMRFTLRARDDEGVVFRHAFDTEQPVTERDVVGVVETLSGIYNREMDRMMHSLSKVVSSHPPCAGAGATGG